MNKRILVVDDEAHIVQVLTLKLRNAGYEVLTARDGEEGLELAIQHGPDLVIADFQMPYMTGLELCRSLAQQPTTARTPVIILTARGYALDDEDLKIGNIRTVLSKPFSPRGILQEVKALLEGGGQPAEDGTGTGVAGAGGAGGSGASGGGAMRDQGSGALRPDSSAEAA